MLSLLLQTCQMIQSVATVETRFYYGAGPSYTVVDAGTPPTPLRFRTDDANDEDTTNPLIVPSSGYNYSYWKQIGLFATVAPDNAINNLKLYCDGTISWTGVDVYVGNPGSGGVVSNYDQATGTEGTTGDEASANHTDTPTMSQIDSYTSASPMSVNGSIAATTGKINDGYVILQARIGTGASAGTLDDETLTWRYDET